VLHLQQGLARAWRSSREKKSLRRITAAMTTTIHVKSMCKERMFPNMSMGTMIDQARNGVVQW